MTNHCAAEPAFTPVECDGSYAKHLQGVCTDERASIFWCFTTELVKTDRAGQVLLQVPVADHHGDLCCHAGHVLVAVNLGDFNRAAGHADSWVYVYDAADLSLVAKHAVPEVVHGAGGIACHAGRFVVVGGLPPGYEENYAYEYDEQFQFVRRHVVQSGYTLMGIQTAAYADGHWWFGCYGAPQSLLRVGEAFDEVARFEFDCSLGIVPLESGEFLVARSVRPEGKHSGRLVRFRADEEQGLAASE